MEPNGRLTSPAAAEVQAALERLVTSAAFRTAPRLAAFLRFVVEATLSGRAAQIKAYTVAVEGLGRPDSFDPVTDAIVRVEGGRLRHALGRYYENDGAGDPVIIEMLRGSYVPQFLWRDAARGATSTDSGTIGSDAAIPATFPNLTEEAQLALRRRRGLFAECHLRLRGIHDSLAGLHAEFAASLTVMHQSRRLIERSRDGESATVENATVPAVAEG